MKDPEFVVAKIMQEHPTLLEKFYKIESNGDVEALLEIFGRKHGFLKKGNQVDINRTARLILKDWQEGKIKKD